MALTPFATLEVSKMLAGVGVADGSGEEAKPKRHHDQIQHGILLTRRAS
jgi:hypothetical protein